MIGKDIIRFHCIIWPALLLAAGYEVPRQIFVHGFLLLDNKKMSKTLGNVIDPLELATVYGADAVRFWCARAVSFGQDGNASIDSLHERYERELGNDLGNLLSRTTAMIARYRGGRLGPVAGESPVALDELRVEVAERFDRFDITGALDTIWQVVRRLNQYVETSAPWQIAKDESRAAELDLVLANLAEGLCAVAIAASVPARDGPSHPRGTAPGRRPGLGPDPSRAARVDRGRRGRAAAVPAHRCAHRRGVIDTHAHLDACADPPEQLVERANTAGVSRIVTIGCGIDSLPHGARDRRPRGGRLRGARDPPAPGRRRRRRRRADRRAARACSPTRGQSRWGRRGSTSSATTPRTTGSGGCSTPSSTSRRSWASRS